jgi:hypothetical protein
VDEPREAEVVAPVEEPAFRIKAKRSRRWLVPVVSMFVASGGAAVWLMARHRARSQTDAIEAATVDAHRFVALVRSGLPAEWSIDRVIEYPTVRPAAQALIALQHERGQARVNLESKVTALWATLGDAAPPLPDLSGFTRWIAHPAYLPRATVAALADDLRKLDLGLGQIRARAGLRSQPLALAGELLPTLPPRFLVPRLGDDVVLDTVQAWPLPLAVTVLQRGHAGSCRDRADSCSAYLVAWLSWEGKLIDATHVAPPPPGGTSWVWGIGPDARLVAVTTDRRGQCTIVEYTPGAEAKLLRARVGTWASVIATPEGLALVSEQGVRALDPGPTLRSVADVAEIRPFDGERLAGRGEQHAPVFLHDGSEVHVTRHLDAVTATVKSPSETVPSLVERLADFTAADEELLRLLVRGPEDRLAVVFEGARGQLTLALSPDGGRTWVGQTTGAGSNMARR